MKIFLKALKIFMFTFNLRLIISLIKNKLDIVKLLHKDLKSILRFGFASACLSTSFLIIRLILSKLKSLLNLYSSNNEINILIEKYELFIVGFIASFTTTIYNKTEINFLKMLIYMRAVEGFFVLA